MTQETFWKLESSGNIHRSPPLDFTCLRWKESEEFKALIEAMGHTEAKRRRYIWSMCPCSASSSSTDKNMQVSYSNVLHFWTSSCKRDSSKDGPTFYCLFIFVDKQKDIVLVGVVLQVALHASYDCTYVTWGFEGCSKRQLSWGFHLTMNDAYERKQPSSLESTQLTNAVI